MSLMACGFSQTGAICISNNVPGYLTGTVPFPVVGDERVTVEVLVRVMRELELSLERANAKLQTIREQYGVP